MLLDSECMMRYRRDAKTDLGMEVVVADAHWNGLCMDTRVPEPGSAASHEFCSMDVTAELMVTGPSKSPSKENLGAGQPCQATAHEHVSCHEPLLLPAFWLCGEHFVRRIHRAELAAGSGQYSGHSAACIPLGYHHPQGLALQQLQRHRGHANRQQAVTLHGASGHLLLTRSGQMPFPGISQNV